MSVNPLKRVIMQACSDAAYRERLLADPKAVLAREGIEVPAEVDVIVHECSENTLLAVLPGPQAAEMKEKAGTLPKGPVEGTPDKLAMTWQEGALKVEGKIDSNTAPALRRELQRAFADVDVDLSKVDFLSSAGLSALLVGQKHLLEHDCRLRLVDVQEAVRNVLDLAGFSELFEVINRQDVECTLMASGWGPACMPY